MGGSFSSKKTAASSGKQELRVLYGASGLVYRTGCGPSEHVLSLARELGRLPGVALTVVFAQAYDPVPAGPYKVAFIDDRGRMPPPGLETDTLVLGINPLHYYTHRKRVLAFAARARVRHDVLIERMWGFGGILARAFQRSGRTVLLEENGPVSWHGGLKKPGDLVRRLYLRLARLRLVRAYRAGRSVIVQTANLAKRLTKEFKVPTNRLEVVPNGVDLARFSSCRASNPDRGQAPLVLVYAGTLDHDHDLRPLCRGAMEWKGKVEIRILGSGPLKGDLEAMRGRPGGECIRLLGRVPPSEVNRHIAEADLCVAPYRSRTHRPMGFQFSPLKILEYAAAGRPIAVAGIPPPAGAARPGVNAFYLPNKAEAWRDLLRNLPDAAARSRMGWAGRDLISESGWSHVAGRYLEMIEAFHGKAVVAPCPYENLENRYIGLLHDHLRDRGVRLVDGGDLRLRWLAAQRGAVDILHLHWPESHYQYSNRLYAFLKWLYLLIRLETARRWGYALVWTVHNLAAHDPILRIPDRWMRRYLLKRGHVLLLGKGTRKALKEHLGRDPAGSVAVIPHGPYTGCYGPQGKRDRCREALDLPLDKKVYLSIGSIRSYKGLGAMARAFLAWDNPGAIWVVAGKAASDAAVAEISSQLAAQKDCFRLIPGFLPDDGVGRFLSAADFVVLPYRNVHMSGALVLALSYGCPVIAPDRGLIREYLPSDAGILYDPEDPSGLEKALKRSERLDAAAMGEKGLRFAQSLSWEEIAAGHEAFYRRLVRVPAETPPGDPPSKSCSRRQSAPRDRVRGSNLMGGPTGCR